MGEPMSDEELARTRQVGAWSNGEKLRLIARIDAAEALAEERLGEVERLKAALKRVCALPAKAYWHRNDDPPEHCCNHLAKAMGEFPCSEWHGTWAPLVDAVPIARDALAALSTPTDEFYEEDEDPAKIHAAFDAGEKFITGPPPFGRLVEPSGNVGNVSTSTEEK